LLSKFQESSGSCYFLRKARILLHVRGATGDPPPWQGNTPTQQKTAARRSSRRSILLHGGG
jgi:hypothetical protein